MATHIYNETKDAVKDKFTQTITNFKNKVGILYQGLEDNFECAIDYSNDKNKDLYD